MRDRAANENGTTVELPAWDALVGFAGLVVSSPQSILKCAYACRELSIRAASGPNAVFDNQLSQRLKSSTRIRQFSAKLADCLVTAGGLPKDMGKRTQAILFDL
jgi:hypothetical protein